MAFARLTLKRAPAGVPCVKNPLLTLFLVFGFAAVVSRANSVARFEALGNNTFAATREAQSTFMRDVDQLKAEALADATTYCAKQHKELKVLSTTQKKPKLLLTGFASARVEFKALEANDPELQAPVAAAVGQPAAASSTASSATDSLYSDLMKLDDLRKRGILTEEEFQAQKKKRLEK